MKKDSVQDVFDSIQEKHILSAIQEIDKTGVPKNRNSTDYDLIYNNKPYPPKYVLSLAAKYATGIELISKRFTGGVNTPTFRLLDKLNFQVVLKAAISMSFWWVNHKQTGKIEVDKGYIWSPQKNNNGSTNQTYINLTKTNPGDIIFSYASGQIPAVGKVIAPARSQKRPKEFGSTGNQWNDEGWHVKVQWQKLLDPLKPKKYLKAIAPLLPSKHSPIQANGNGNQGVYLAAISSELGNKLLSLIDQSNDGTSELLEDIYITFAEKKEEKEIEEASIQNTQKEQLILARVGQGQFRVNVQKIESKCRITGVSDKRLLVASHIKPWKDCSNQERLDGHNGFLLSPHIDKLFDKGWISFSDKGDLLISQKTIRPILKHWFIDPDKSVGTFTQQQKKYLLYHRTKIFKG